jgi:hypothetical protein
MTVMLITARRAAEMLAAFHRQRVDNTAAEARAYHKDMARRCAEDAERITRGILTAGVTVENQASAARRRDLDTAQKIIDRHPIMHGVGMPVEDVAQARVAMAGDIADALAAERGGLPAA